MAVDLTKQRIVFLSLIATNPDGISADDIYDGMGILAKEIGWPAYFRHVPQPLEALIEEYRDADLMQLCRPLTWQPVSVEELKNYIFHTVQAELAGDEDENARDILGQKLELDLSPKVANIQHHMAPEEPAMP